MGYNCSMKNKNLESARYTALKSAVSEWLQSNNEPEIKAFGKELELSEVIIKKSGIHIGSWIYEEEESGTLTKYLEPDKSYGFDYILHIVEKNGVWQIVKLEKVEVSHNPSAF